MIRSCFRSAGVLLLLVVAGVGPDQAEPLVVGIKQTPPFTLRNAQDEWHGLSVGLWENVATELGYDYVYRELALPELQQAVESGEVDIAIGALTVTAEREQRFDFTQPFMTSGLGIAVRNDGSGGWLRALLGILSLGLLRIVASLALLLLACGLLVWLFERRRNPEMFGGRPAQGIGSGFWWAAVTMTTVGYGDKAPLTLGGRVVAIFWMFASLIVISGFTAAIASALTIGGLSGVIRGPEELSQVRVATVDGSASAQWLTHRHIEHQSYVSIEQMLDAVESNRAEAAVYDAPILLYVARQRETRALSVLPRTFAIQPYAFALPPGSELREPVNRALLQFITQQEWADLCFVYTGERPL